MKNFVLIGAAGYIAPRHMKAIRDTGNHLVAALDRHDSVGVLDEYFPEADFFTEFERFDRHCEKLLRSGVPIDYVSVCSPNYLHDAHIRFGLRLGADVICEKPVVLNPWNVDALMDLEEKLGRKVYSVLQLRNHPDIVELRKRVNDSKQKKFVVDLHYITRRGRWYDYSWKGDADKSGGILCNIGFHFFDLLGWIFGEVQKAEIMELSSHAASGKLEMEKAIVNWRLGILHDMLPEAIRNAGGRSYRRFIVDGEEIDLGLQFDDLHTSSYRDALAGKGVRLEETRKTISLLHELRQMRTTPIVE